MQLEKHNSFTITKFLNGKKQILLTVKSVSYYFMDKVISWKTIPEKLLSKSSLQNSESLLYFKISKDDFFAKQQFAIKLQELSAIEKATNASNE